MTIESRQESQFRLQPEWMIDILETYEYPKLSDDVLENVRSIVVDAEKELGVYGGDDLI